MATTQVYLGNNVYADFETLSGTIVLTTEDMKYESSTIYVDRSVWRNLCRFAAEHGFLPDGSEVIWR